MNLNTIFDKLLMDTAAARAKTTEEVIRIEITKDMMKKAWTHYLK